AVAPSPPMLELMPTYVRPSLRFARKYVNTSGVAPLPAMIRSGMACASAPNTISGRLWQTIVRPHVGAGGWQFSSDPSRARTVTGRKLPSLFGTPGSSASLIGYMLYDRVMLNVTFTAAGTSGDEPS